MSWTSETVKENRTIQNVCSNKYKNTRTACVWKLYKSGVGPSEQNCSAPAAARRKLGG